MSLLYQNIFDISIRFFAFFRNNGLLSIKFFCVTLPHMSICTRVVVSITFHQVDYAPDTKTGTDCNDQCLKDIDCTAKKSHNQMYEQTLFLMVCKRLALLLSLLFRPFCTPAQQQGARILSFISVLTFLSFNR